MLCPQMGPLLFLTPAVVGAPPVSECSCSTAPPSTPLPCWPHPSTRPPSKVCDMWRARACEGLRRLCVTLSLCRVAPSGHTECLDLLLAWGAHTDVELPAAGTPLYSACVARAAGCAMSLLHSGIRVIKNCDNQFGFKECDVNKIFESLS